MKKRLIFALALSSVMGFAQDYNGRVGINTDEPKASLDIARHMTIPAENPQGLLLPQLTKDQRDAFNQEKLVNGLMIFNTTKNCIDWYDGEKWSCTDGSNTDYTPVNTTSERYIRAHVWDRTHYIGSFNHNGANIDGVIDNTTNKITLQIPYNQATEGEAYNEINVKRTIKDRNGKNILLTLNIPAGTFDSYKGFLEGTIKVGNGTTDIYKVKQLDANKEETITEFNFSINGRVSNVRLVASGGVLDRMFGIETNGKLEHQFIYVPIATYGTKVVELENFGSSYERKWLNNNLGANYAKVGNNQHTQQATSINDHNAYGSLFQWQRKADGHELVNWRNGTTVEKASPAIDSPKGDANWIASHSNFIYDDTTSLSWVDYDTTNNKTQNKDLWESKGANNPCPEGYHIPDYIEWSNFKYGAGDRDNNGVLISTNNSNMLLPYSGYRRADNGDIVLIGSKMGYWSGEPYYYSRYLANLYVNYDDDDRLGTHYDFFGMGHNVRCIAD